MRRLPARGRRRRGAALSSAALSSAALSSAALSSAGLALALLAGAASLGCTEFAPGEDVLGSTRGELEPTGPGEDWSCLKDGGGMFAAPAPVAAGTAPSVMYRLQFIDLSSGRVYQDVQVRACGVADPTCANPVSPVMPVDEEGRVSVPLFENFVGFLEVQSPQIVPTMYYVLEPLQPTLDPEYPYALVSVEAVPSLVQLTGVQPQLGTGIFATRAFDCTGVPAPNVAFDINVRGDPFYFVRGLPSGTATSTDSTGLAGFTNVLPGLAIVEGTLPDGTSIAGPQSIVIRDGWLSAFFLRPPGRMQAAARP